MAYFSSGSEGRVYQVKYCNRCVHDENHNCVVWLLHLTCEDEDEVLDMLIPRDGIKNLQCSMFVPRPEVKP